MTLSPFDERRRLETLSRESLAGHQLARLNHLLWQSLPNNRFYREKLAASLDLAAVDRGEDALKSLEQLSQLPFTLKDELQSPDDANLARNLTFERSRYVRFHHTSGTRGRPLVVLDTADDWKWWIECWQYVLDAAGARSEDCVLLAFSFGPFIGFWSAHDAAVARGCLVTPGGGLGTLARLELMRTARPAIVCCTPSYALHMAEVAADNGIDVGALGVRQIIFAGEPGGSVPAMRQRIESAWQARVLDHSGATEVGPWGYGDVEQRGLHVLESEFIAEFISVETGEAAREGELAELVITNLGRVGCPVIRYRTGDLVRPVWNHSLKNRFVLLDGGVLGRVDDMMIVRGVNVFPSSVEQILRGFPDVLEYRLTVSKVAEMDHLRVEIEDRLDDSKRVAEELRVRLGLKVEVTCVPLDSLPRFEGKGRRFIDQRPGRATPK